MDALEDFFAGSGLSVRALHELARAAQSLITRIEGRDPKAPTLAPDGPHRRRSGEPRGLEPRPVRRRAGRRHRVGPRRHRHAEHAPRRWRWPPAGWPRSGLAAARHAHLPGGGRRGGGRHTTAPATWSKREPEAVRCRLRDHRERRRADPDAVGAGASAPPSARRAATARRLVVKGTPGHGSAPFRTDNALVTAARVVAAHRRLPAEGEHPRRTGGSTSRRSSLDPERHRRAHSTRTASGTAARGLDNLRLAREAHACTHTTFSPNVVRGGQQGERDPRPRRGRGGHPRAARRDAARRCDHAAPRPSATSPPRSRSSGRRAGWARWRRSTRRWRRDRAASPAADAGQPRSCPRSARAGPTRASSAGAASRRTASALHSTRIPYTEYPLMFHGNDERVDTESLRLSALMWDALCRDFLG